MLTFTTIFLALNHSASLWSSELTWTIISYCCSIYFIVVPISIWLLFDLCFHLILLFFIVHCSLFKEKRCNSEPGLYSRHFDPIVHEVPVHRHLCKSNKHHTSDCTDFVLVQERVAYDDHRHSRIYGTNILQVIKASRGRDIYHLKPSSFYMYTLIYVYKYIFWSVHCEAKVSFSLNCSLNFSLFCTVSYYFSIWYFWKHYASFLKQKNANKWNTSLKVLWSRSSFHVSLFCQLPFSKKS